MYILNLSFLKFHVYACLFFKFVFLSLMAGNFIMKKTVIISRIELLSIHVFQDKKAHYSSTFTNYTERKKGKIKKRLKIVGNYLRFLQGPTGKVTHDFFLKKKKRKEKATGSKWSLNKGRQGGGLGVGREGFLFW